jgi:uncharacterized membrane protein
MRSKVESDNRNFMAGLIAGGTLLYFLDPDKCGHRRRIVARDKVIRAEHLAGRFADKTVRDLQNRAKGLLAEAWASIREREVPDEVLVRRVCARVGRAVSHPHALRVEAYKGVAKLYGPVLEDEIDELLRTVRSVRGVRAVEDHLEPHKTADIPSLQGGKHRSPQPELLQERWAPATRALVGLGGVGLLSLARSKRGLSVPLGVTGGALLMRALTNKPLGEALGLADTPDVITLRKTINISAPVEELYQLFANPENFPNIFEHVEDVRQSRDNLYHWRVVGPAGMPVSWEAAVTQNAPNEVIAWSSVPGAAVQTAGWVKFQRNESGGTTLHIQFTYNPPAGVIGHAIASLFGADPKQALDDDMARLKSLFEVGKTRVHGHRVTREEVEREIAPDEERGKSRAAGQG